ncbi:MAG: SDR family oxidoreductase, partial [Syntrophorhabdus sp.]
MSLKDQREIVVVTGGSAGCGRAIVEEFARHNAAISIVARGEERLDDAIKEVVRLGGQAIAIPTDVSDPDAVDRAAAKTEQTFGPIDIWVNDAMASMVAPIRDMKPAEFRRVTEVTYLGVVWGTMAALKRMLPRGSGTIIQIGSALAYRSIPLQSAYCGAKSAIRGFTDSLRSELIHMKSNVKVSMVQMPAMNTPQFDWIRSRMPKKAQPV